MKKPVPHLTHLTPLTLLTLAASGCQLLTYHSPTGERFTRTSCFANTSVV